MFKKILPVGIGIILIVLIAVCVSVVKKSNDRTPSIADANSSYVSYGDLNITNDRLYTYMKKDYGISELLNMVDEAIFKDEVAKVDVASEDFTKYVNNQVFKVEDLADADAEEAQKAWDNVISSLQVSGLLSKADAQDNAYDNLDSNVWKVVKDYYKLAYARTEWAKKAYLDKYYNDRNDGKWFDDTKTENSTSSIEAYYENNYKGNVVGFFIPFTSEKAAYAMMEKYGINTNSNVLSMNDGWVSSSYDYFTKQDPDADEFLTYTEVVEAFIGMYNEIFKYQTGADIITSSSYAKTLKETQTAYLVQTALTSVLGSSYGTKLTLPGTVSITGQDDATITWTVAADESATITDNVLVADFSKEDDIDVNLKYIIKFGEAEVSGSKKVTFKATRDESNNIIEKEDTLTLTAVDPFYSYAFTEDFLTAQKDSEFNRFEWTVAAAKEINSSLGDYLCVDGKLTLSDAPEKLYKSYTETPVKIGNYYYLIIKLEETAQGDLFVKDANGTIELDDKDNAKVADQALYDEIVEKMKQDLLTDNVINQMIYEERQNHKVTIYDSYLEALYEYEYTQFYETTLKETDYAKYKKSKKNQKKVVVSYQAEAGNKKSVVKVDANELYSRLQTKYASSSVASMIENYNLVSNKEFNDIFNPYTGEIYNKTSYKNLMNSEINTLRKNFESGYFTYSYLSYYGFTPNFPAKYGWKKFIKDYFVAYSDEDLLTSSTYGGSVYSDALAAYTDTLYDYNDIKAEMEKEMDKYYSVSTINLIVSIDYDYNADDSASDNATKLLAEKDNWSEEQKTLAVELAKFMYAVADQTNMDTLSDQMTELVSLYNDAAYDYDSAAWDAAKAANTSIYDYNYFGKYKLAGLQVKFEKSADYDASSSIYEEYADVCRALFAKAKELSLLDTTFDVPLLCDEPFTTDYGYHMIAILSAKAMKELPSEEEIEIYHANKLLEDAKSEAKTAQENIDKYAASGYNAAGYQAAKDLADAKVEKYQAQLDAVLAKYNHESDYTLDEDASARIDAWYTSAEKTIESGTIVTEAYINALKSQLDSYKFANAENKTKLADFLDLLQAECDKQNAE